MNLFSTSNQNGAPRVRARAVKIQPKGVYHLKLSPACVHPIGKFWGRSFSNSEMVGAVEVVGGVGDGVAVGVAVGVELGVAVAVEVGLGVGTKAAVGVGVAVAVGVPVAAGVGLGVGCAIL